MRTAKAAGSLSQIDVPRGTAARRTAVTAQRKRVPELVLDLRRRAF